MLSDLIAGEQGEYPLDLRAGKAPFTHKDNDVFDINDLDGVYDYVNGSKEWFVDVYANTIIDRFPHADYTGSALTSATFEEALKSEPKTAYDKFVARLEELGLWEEWCQQGRCGRIAKTTQEGIIILCNEGECDKVYTESFFPPMSKMQEDDDFRLNALYEFCDHDDSGFIYNLCLWVARPNENKCPLFPVDVYFCWDSPKVTCFEDDVQENTNKPTEWCSNCLEDAEIVNEFKVQKCPNCGEWLVPCSLCPLEDCVKVCPLERLATMLNEKDTSE